VTYAAGAVSVVSRHGRDLSRYFPDVALAVAVQLASPAVLDGELVVWASGRLEFSALQARLVAGGRLAELVVTRPASYVVFDLLEVAGVDVRPLPYRQRRQLLEVLLADARPPLQLTPQTTDRAEALVWFTDWAAAGVEGLVVRGLDQPYLPNVRGWMKIRRRRTVEAVVGAVSGGSLEAPARLVLGAHDGDGRLRVLGSTTALAAAVAREVGAVLRPPQRPHPWPTVMHSHLLGGLAGQRPATAVTLVEPATVVEVAADTAFDAGRWRHPVRFLRIRAELHPMHVRVGDDGVETRR
jgi:ATP-dependent DNA ligase